MSSLVILIQSEMTRNHIWIDVKWIWTYLNIFWIYIDFILIAISESVQEE